MILLLKISNVKLGRAGRIPTEEVEGIIAKGYRLNIFSRANFGAGKGI